MIFNVKNLEQHAKEFFASTHFSDGKGNLDAPIDWQSCSELDDDPEDDTLSMTKVIK